MYRIVAPGVAQLMVTLCGEVYVPPSGTKVGVATTSCTLSFRLPPSSNREATSIKYAVPASALNSSLEVPDPPELSSQATPTSAPQVPV